MRGLFPGTPTLPAESDNFRQLLEFVTTRWPTNINVVPIDYAFRPRLRDRLTLLRLALSRNPWTFGDSVSHTVYRYSCQHSLFRYLQMPSRVILHRLTERSATAPVGYADRQKPEARSQKPEGRILFWFLVSDFWFLPATKPAGTLSFGTWL